jgi:hypothetical protein
MKNQKINDLKIVEKEYGFFRGCYDFLVGDERSYYWK